MNHVQKKKWQRVLSTALTIALLVPIGFISGTSTVEGASLKTITSVNTTTEVGDTLSYNVTLDDGSRMHFSNYNFVREDGPNIITKTGNHTLFTNGTVQKSNGTAINGSGYTQMVEIQPSGVSTFALKSDGTLWAWGAGTSGQLGIGSFIDRTQPAEVVDPVTGDPMTGVKKIFALSKDSVLFVTDNAAYVVGNAAMGLNPKSNARPKQITEMPSFSSAANFDFGFFNAADAVDPVGRQIYNTNGDSNPFTAPTEIRWFKISGTYYLSLIHI